MKLAICDDNHEYINTLENYLDEFKVSKLEYDVFLSGEDLVFAYENNNASYDAIFLDMEMGELDGIEAANRIRKIDKHVIIVFVTIHEKYWQQSFECMPFRFLIKPLRFEDLAKVYKEICEKLKDRPETIVFMENRNRTRLFCDDIIFFESSSHWIIIHTADGKTHKTRKTITELIETVDNTIFVRIHRAFVVNLNHIYKINDNTVIMHDYADPLPLSRTFKKELTDTFLNLKERKYLL